MGDSGREGLADVERQVDKHELAADGALELVDTVDLVADAGVDHAVAVRQEEHRGVALGGKAADEGVWERRRRAPGRRWRRGRPAGRGAPRPGGVGTRGAPTRGAGRPDRTRGGA